MITQILNAAAVAALLGGLILVASTVRAGYLVAGAGYVLGALVEAADHMQLGALGFLAVAARMYQLWSKGGPGRGLRITMPRRRVVLT
jgi:hypothetical protein